MTEENTERRPGRKAGEILRAIARGEFLFTLKCDKFFPHIIYFFFLICIVLAVNLMIEKTMVEAERNKAIGRTRQTEQGAGNARSVRFGADRSGNPGHGIEKIGLYGRRRQR